MFPIKRLKQLGKGEKGSANPGVGKPLQGEWGKLEAGACTGLFRVENKVGYEGSNSHSTIKLTGNPEPHTQPSTPLGCWIEVWGERTRYAELRIFSGEKVG